MTWVENYRTSWSNLETDFPACIYKFYLKLKTVKEFIGKLYYLVATNDAHPPYESNGYQRLTCINLKRSNFEKFIWFVSSVINTYLSAFCWYKIAYNMVSIQSFRYFKSADL